MKKYVKPDAKFVVIDTENVMDPALDFVSIVDEDGGDEQLAGEGLYERDLPSAKSVWSD